MTVNLHRKPGYTTTSNDTTSDNSLGACMHSTDQTRENSLGVQPFAELVPGRPVLFKFVMFWNAKAWGPSSSWDNEHA